MFISIIICTNILYLSPHIILFTLIKNHYFCLSNGLLCFSLIKNSKSYRTAALLVVPATFVAIIALLVKELNVNQLGLKILLDIQWETLWNLDVCILYKYIV